MNKKVMQLTLTLIVIVTMVTPLIGTAQARGYIGNWRKPKTVATFDSCMQYWPTISQPDFEVTQIGNGLIISKNLYVIGEEPLLTDYASLPIIPGDSYPRPGPYHPRGGIELNLNDGTNVYTLIGDVSGVLLFTIRKEDAIEGFQYAKWSFTITQAIGNAPDNAVGSTMDGWTATVLKGMEGSTGVYVSTGGTGIFEGAKLSGKYTMDFYLFIGKNGNEWLLADQTGSGKIVFP